VGALRVAALAPHTPAVPPLTPLLLQALRDAPRRYRLPSLPTDAGTALAAGTDTALAFAIESVRRAVASRHAASPELADLFTTALARLVTLSLSPERGDPAFQALVLQADEPQLREYVQLAAAAPADRRTVRAAVNAIAHPGKTRDLPAGPLRDALATLHRLAGEEHWAALEPAARGLLPLSPALQDSVQAIVASPERARLQRLAALQRAAPVQRYLALCGRRGPLAGSDAAAAQGRASAREGNRAEAAGTEAFARIATLLDAHAPGAAFRAVAGLRTPPGFPGSAAKAKDEWDVALVHGSELVLLAEVKASPAAATSDLPRLLRGLERLAHAQAEAVYEFAASQGAVALRGESLRALRPQGRALPPQVFYCCDAPPEAQPPVLSAAAKAVLLAEPASIAFAQQVLAGGAPPPATLLPAWQDLPHAPRLHATLHQYDTACAAREAMLHPDDLLAAVQARLSHAR
jgi:hypothetical protein